MKTNASFLPTIGQDQYILFCLDEIGHHSTNLIHGMILTPGVLCGCEFYTVRWIDLGSRQVFYLIFHMSGNYTKIIELLQLVRTVADPATITVTAEHRPPDSNERPFIVAANLGIPLQDIKHVHNADPLVLLGALA